MAFLDLVLAEGLHPATKVHYVLEPALSWLLHTATFRAIEKEWQ
jgi:hypothetical protein